MRIIYISTEREWHGGEEQLRLLVEGARREGHDCLLVARAGSAFAQRMNTAGHEVVQLHESVRGPRSMWRLRRTVCSYKPDVIHVNDGHSLTLARFALWGCSGYGRVAARRVLFPIRSSRKYAAWCDRIICVSHAIAQVCRQSGIPNELLRVVHDGVDPNRMLQGDANRGRKTLALAEDQPLVLCVAQMAPYKGHRYLIEAMPAILDRFPNTTLALAGDGPLRKELVARATRLGIAHAVHFLGYRQDIPDLVSACDLFVLPSPEEGLGSSLLDAMFAGKPVVGVNAGGIPEMLRDAPSLPSTGWLAQARDPDALAAAMVEALDSAPLRTRHGLAGQARAQQSFSCDHMVAGTLAVYRDLIADDTMAADNTHRSAA